MISDDPRLLHSRKNGRTVLRHRSSKGAITIIPLRKARQATVACGSQRGKCGPTHKIIEEQVAKPTLSNRLPAKIIFSVLSNSRLLELHVSLSPRVGLCCVS